MERTGGGTKSGNEKKADGKAQCAALGWECVRFAMDHYGCFEESSFCLMWWIRLRAVEKQAKSLYCIRCGIGPDSSNEYIA